MKIKPSDKAGGVVVELGPKENQLPSEDPRKRAAALPVFQLKKILVPVDFSECSKKALQYAIPFAEQFGAELILLHLVQRYPQLTDALPVPLESVEDDEKDLEALRATIGGSVRSRAVVHMGDPRIGIIDAAEEFDIDLIIISTHGRMGLDRMLLGSTAEKVVRHAVCPVLIVREHEHEFVRDRKGGMAEPATAE
jgi:universal stress protein A